MRQDFFQGIFFGSLRAFFVMLTGTIGVVLGIFIFLLAISGASSSNNKYIDQKYDVQILANADNVRKEESKKSPVILQLNIHGVIGGESLNLATIRQQLLESREGDLKGNRVKALFLHIDTPGGTATDADGIYRHIRAYKEQYKVPVYAYVDGLCASGGMYVAAAADKIFASKASLVGSVGVIAPSFFNVSKLIDRLGIESETISAGIGKDDMNPFRPWKADEDRSYKEIIKNFYDIFVDVVSSARPRIGKENLIAKYGAQVFPAEQAQEYGYIDQADTDRNEALKKLLHEMGIDDDYYQVMALESTNWIAQIFNPNNTLFRGTINHKLEFPPELDPKLCGKVLYLYTPGR